MKILEKAVSILKKALKPKWLLIIIVFVLLFYVLSTLFVSVPYPEERARDARRVADIRAIQNALEISYPQNGIYPDTINDLPYVEDNYYIYETVGGGAGYKLGVCMEQDDHLPGSDNCPAELECEHYFCVSSSEDTQEDPASPDVIPMPQPQNATSEDALDETTQNLHFFEDPAIDLTQIKVNVFFFVPRNLAYGTVLKDYFNLIEGGAFYEGDAEATLDIKALTEKLTLRAFPAMQEFHRGGLGSDLELEFAVYPKTIYGFEEDRFYQSDLREVPPREVMIKINSELRNRVFTKTGDLYDQAFAESDSNKYVTNVIIYAGFPPMSDDIHGQTIFTPAFTNYSKSAFLVFSPPLEPRATFNADSMIYHELLHALGVPEQYNRFSLDFFIERNERADIMGQGSDKPLSNTYIGEDIKRKMGSLPGGFEPMPDEEELFRDLSEEAKSFFTMSKETRRHYDDSNPYKSFFRDRDRDGLIDTMDSGGYLHLVPRWSAFRSTSSLPGASTVFYRYVKDCPTRETVERQIIDTSYGYSNYQGTDRYEEQCINDGSFDLYYVESLVPLEGTPSS